MKAKKCHAFFCGHILTIGTQTNNKLKTKTDGPMGYNWQQLKMKFIFKVLFVLSLMASPVILTSCEKDHGTTPYDDTDDNDWKKAPAVEYDDITSFMVTPTNENK